MTTHELAPTPHGNGRLGLWPNRLAPMSAAVQRALGPGIYVLTSLIGVFIFLYPFLAGAVTQSQAGAGMQNAGAVSSPLAMALIIVLCLAALTVEAQGQAMSAKLVALLGVLIAINSILRLAETAFPGPGGFSPVFLLVILCGYVFGPRFGFLMGALSLLVSALFVAGIGPWLPNQMFTAGWMGMSAGWLGHLRFSIVDFGFGRSRDSDQSKIQNPKSKIELLALMGFGVVWGLLYGAIMNLWFWPFQAGSPEQSYQAGISVGQTIQRYLVFYLATSLVWDLFAAVGNAVLLALFGLPTLKALRRFKSRFLFEAQE